MSENKIVTLTMNPTIDKSASLAQIEPNKKLRCQNPTFAPGGGGINAVRAIYKLGGEAKVVYPGGGPTGDMLEKFLTLEKIPQRRIPTESWTRENLTIEEDNTQNQYRFGMPGAVLQEHEWKNCLEIILQESQSAEFLIASGSLPPGVPEDFYARLAQRVRGSSVKLIVDTSGEPLRKLKGSGVYLLKPNLRELRELTGFPLTNEKEQAQAAAELVKNGTCSIVLLSLGAGGALLVTADTKQWFRSPAVTVKSRIGAGDSTVGGLVLGLSRNLDLKEAVLFGIASGAAAVMTSANELCRREDAEQIFQDMKEVSLLGAGQ